MKTEVFKDKEGCKYIYNDDTGMFFPFDPILLDVLEHDGNLNITSSPDYQTRYYLNLFQALRNMQLSVNQDAELALNELNSRGMTQLILKTTDRCNLRCKYCIYSEHYFHSNGYSDSYLGFDDARMAVDEYLRSYQISKKYNTRTPVVAFYGGEPLLAFELIKDVVNYIKAEYPDIKLNYTITTNGLFLANREVSEFLKQNGFWVIVSLDGTKSNHDRYRVTEHGKPTYDFVHEAIRKHFYDYPDIYSICCYDISSNLLELNAFYEKNDRRNGGDNPALLRASLINDSFTDYYDSFSDLQIEEFDRQRTLLLDGYIMKKQRGEKPSIFSDILFSQLFFWISERKKFIQNSSAYCTSCGACIPGEKISVETDGSYSPCEKVVSKGFEIGCAHDGFCREKSRAIIAELNNNVLSLCRRCGISRLCQICYSSLLRNPEVSFGREMGCCMNKKAYLDALGEYISIIKKRPDAFKVRLDDKRTIA